MCVADVRACARAHVRECASAFACERACVLGHARLRARICACACACASRVCMCVSACVYVTVCERWRSVFVGAFHFHSIVVTIRAAGLKLLKARSERLSGDIRH